MIISASIPMDIVERLIVYRDRPGRSREGRDLLADACNEIIRLREGLQLTTSNLREAMDMIAAKPKA
jgi:hypothetical protein